MKDEPYARILRERLAFGLEARILLGARQKPHARSPGYHASAKGAYPIRSLNRPREPQGRRWSSLHYHVYR